MEYRLDIYTWPAMRGINPQVRSSVHETPGQAIAHLDSQTEPYHLAVLLMRTETGWGPCDWDGLSAMMDWPSRKGTNGEHPDYLALMDDWLYLVSEVRRLYELGGRGTMDIADELLKERHPGVWGWAHTLGWEAASR